MKRVKPIVNKIKVFDLVPRHVLVTRESARSLETYLAEALQTSPGEITLDLSEIEGFAPSFLDEVMSILDENISLAHPLMKVTLAAPPTRLSSKFVAIARSHGRSASEESSGAWTIGPSNETATITS